MVWWLTMKLQFTVQVRRYMCRSFTKTQVLKTWGAKLLWAVSESHPSNMYPQPMHRNKANQSEMGLKRWHIIHTGFLL